MQEYIDAILDATMGKGAELQAKAFREGFSKVFPVTDLQAFSPDELGLVIGSAEEDWTPESLFLLRDEQMAYKVTNDLC